MIYGHHPGSPLTTSSRSFSLSLSFFTLFEMNIISLTLSHSLSVSLPPSLSLSIKTDRDESRGQIIRACDSRHLLLDSSNKALRANARSPLHRSPFSLHRLHTHTHTYTLSDDTMSNRFSCVVFVRFNRARSSDTFRTFDRSFVD